MSAKKIPCLLAILSLVAIASCATNPQPPSPEAATSQNPEVTQTEPVSEVAEPEVTEPVDPLAEFDMAKAAILTDTARFLAGMEALSAESGLAATFRESGIWVSHADFFNTSWGKLETQQLEKVRSWSAQELASLNQETTPIFYPFGGPDFLYVTSMFPNGSEYILVGLEPVGTMPDFTSIDITQAGNKLQEVRGSLQAILQFSFFRTKDMEVDLSQQGVLPLLFVFLARTNHRILDVQSVGIDAEATIQPQTEGADLVPGVKIDFVDIEGDRPQTLYYFSTDLSNGGLEATPEFVEFVKQRTQPITYLKAASYLMHRDGFSTVRDLVFSQSRAILQDDSGIPLQFFDRDRWDLTFYGSYVAPINLFKNRYQSDLREAYSSNANVKPIDFGIGYKFYADANMMLATPK